MAKQLCTDFEASKCLGALHTGGHVEWRGQLIFTSMAGAINIVKDASVIHKLEEEEDAILIFTTALQNEAITLVTAHKSGLLRQYRLEEDTETWRPQLVRTFRSIHTGPISLMKIHMMERAKLLATGGADGTLKIWDLDHQYYTHNFKSGSSVCSVIMFHPTKLIVFGGFSTGSLFSWDLTTSQEINSFVGHFSAVTGLQMTKNEDKLVSAGRDKVVIIWDVNTGAKEKTIPVAGSVEGLHSLETDLMVVLAVESSLVKWDLTVPRRMEAVDLGSQIIKMQSQQNSIHCSTLDDNLVDVTCPDLTVVNTVVGNNDEVLCLSLAGEADSHLVVGCNSSFIRLYRVSDYTCKLVGGHTDTVMCVNSSTKDRNLLVTGSKDRTVRLWRLDPEAGDMKCVMTGSGHSDPVQGVTFLNLSVNTVISVAKDTTIKAWKIDYESEQMSSIRTEIGHEKEINCCCVSPGDELVATGSQDKLCKVWNKDLELVATLRGHKRGVWSAQFNPQDQLLATGSADAIIKVWNLTEFTCVKQLEGQECSVLSLTWISGHQLVSSGSDGLLKVWWVTRQECVSTLDQHTGKVWSLVSRQNGDGEVELASGSSAGELVFWKDITQISKAKKQDEADKLMLGQQKLANLIASKQFSEALKMALRLSQPFTALKLLKKLKYEEISEAILGLNMPEIDQLLGYAVKWNSNSRHSVAAQSVLSVILSNHKPDELLTLSGCKDWVEGLLPYTEKHFQRLSRLQMKSKFLVFLQANMKATGLEATVNQSEDMDDLVKEE